MILLIVAIIVAPIVIAGGIQLRNASRNNALLQAIRDNDTSAVQSLLRDGLDPNRPLVVPKEVTSLADIFRRSIAIWPKGMYESVPPICMAAGLPDSTIANMLLEKGADPNALDPQGYSPIDIVTSISSNSKETDLVSMAGTLLRHHANVMGSSSSYNRPLVSAAAFEKPKLVDLIIQYGGPHHEMPEYLGLALYYASLRNVEITKSLLSAGADPNFTDQSEPSPLEGAVVAGNKQIVKILLDYGANPNQKGHGDWLPIDFARHNKHLDIVAILKDAMAKRKAVGSSGLKK
ncbi:MAG: ankyrin repeat domain-containing protein [Chthonomonadales bacterium]